MTTEEPTTDEMTTEEPTTDEMTTEEPTSVGTVTVPTDLPSTSDFENCKQLDQSLSLSWTVNRDSESVVFMLCGCASSNTAL